MKINFRNKKMLALGIILSTLLLATIIPNVIGVPPTKPPKTDLDWDHWTNKPDMFSMMTGNVGIGTMEPETKLDVVGIIQARSFGGIGLFQIKRDDITQVWSQKIRNDGAFVLYDQTYNKNTMVIETNSENNSFYINNEGYVGINNLDPDAELDVHGNITISGDYKYSTEKTRYLNLPPSSFQSLYTWYYSNYPQDWVCSKEGYAYPDSNSGSNTIELICPILLPEGSFIINFTVYYYDDSSSGNIEVKFELMRRAISSTSTEFMARVYEISGGKTIFIRSSYNNTITNQIINPFYQYYIYGYINHPWGGANNDYRFYGCRIEYTQDAINY